VSSRTSGTSVSLITAQLSLCLTFPEPEVLCTDVTLGFKWPLNWQSIELPRRTAWVFPGLLCVWINPGFIL
jgi:hypothetical protein